MSVATQSARIVKESQPLSRKQQRQWQAAMRYIETQFPPVAFERRTDKLDFAGNPAWVYCRYKGEKSCGPGVQPQYDSDANSEDTAYVGEEYKPGSPERIAALAQFCQLEEAVALEDEGYSPRSPFVVSEYETSSMIAMLYTLLEESSDKTEGTIPFDR